MFLNPNFILYFHYIDLFSTISSIFFACIEENLINKIALMVLFAGDFFSLKMCSYFSFQYAKFPPRNINPSSRRKNAGTIRLLV
jgi:hypothetical protein